MGLYPDLTSPTHIVGALSHLCETRIMNVDENNAGHEVCLFVVCVACFCALSFLTSFQAHCQSHYSSDKPDATGTLSVRDWTYPAILPALGQDIWEDTTTL